MWLPIAYHSGRSDTWRDHSSFALWLMAQLRPKVFVELGVYAGDSYCVFCQAVTAFDLPTRCFGVDDWTGEFCRQSGFPTGNHDGNLEDLRLYHDAKYGAFSTLLPMTFDEARPYFDEIPINLLHIDGCHLTSAVRHDYENWLPALADDGVVLFHDTNISGEGLGVVEFWRDLRQHHPSFEFRHSCGLGVIAPKSVPPVLTDLFAASEFDIAYIEQLSFQASAGSIPGAP